MEIRVLRGTEVRRFLQMAECIDLMQTTMIAVSEGRAVLPLRSVMVMPGELGMMGNMPGYLAAPQCFGVKLVSLIPHNKPPQYSSHLGLVLLFEAEHGRPVALLDGAEITAIRTAAASGLATRILARPDAGDLTLLGAGEQARSHLEAMLTVRALRRIRIWARDSAKAAAFAKLEGARHQIEIEVSSTVREAVAGADIICTLTKAREPILLGEWIASRRTLECGRLECRRHRGNRHGSRREIAVFRRLSRIDVQRRWRIHPGRSRRAPSRRSIFWLRSAK